MATDRPLSRKMQQFVEELLANPRMEGTAAALAAGYAPRGARKAAHELLQDERIKAAIAKGMEERAKRTRIKADRILKELAALALSNIDHYVIDDDGHVKLKPDAPATALRAVSSIKRRRNVERKGDVEYVSVETEIKLWDKNPALANAMKHLGLLKDKVEVSGPEGGPIPTSVTVTFVEPAQKPKPETKAT